MMRLIYKDHLIYLFLISILAYVGACFTGNVMSHMQLGLNLKILAMPFLLINSFLIFFLILNYFDESLIAFTISALYLVAPTHFDIFVYPFQFQSLLAETGLLAFLFLYQMNHTWKALFALLVSLLLNTKLILFIPFLWGMKRLNKLQKVCALAVLSIVLLYLIPSMYQESFFAFDQFKTIFYIWEKLILAASVSVLNISVIDPGYYNVFYIVVSLLVVITILIYGLKKNHDVLKISSSFILASLLGATIPFKQINKTDDYFYFFLPSFYPMVLLSILILIAFVMHSLNLKGKFSKLLIGFLGIYWLCSALYVQKNFQNVMQEWSHSIAYLPEDYNYEAAIKLKYTRLLVDDGYPDEAIKIINSAKLEFPDVRWYSMLLEIASKKGDKIEMDKIYEELRLSKAPFKSSEIEND